METIGTRRQGAKGRRHGDRPSAASSKRIARSRSPRLSNNNTAHDTRRFPLQLLSASLGPTIPLLLPSTTSESQTPNSFVSSRNGNCARIQSVLWGWSRSPRTSTSITGGQFPVRLVFDYLFMSPPASSLLPLTVEFPQSPKTRYWKKFNGKCKMR